MLTESEMLLRRHFALSCSPILAEDTALTPLLWLQGSPEESPSSSLSRMNLIPVLTEDKQEAARWTWIRSQGSRLQGPRSRLRSIWTPAEGAGGRGAGLRVPSRPEPPPSLRLPCRTSPRSSSPAPALRGGCGSAGQARRAGTQAVAAAGRSGSGAGSRAQPRPAPAPTLAHPRPAWGARRARGAQSARRAGLRTSAGAARRSDRHGAGPGAPRAGPAAAAPRRPPRARPRRAQAALASRSGGPRSRGAAAAIGVGLRGQHQLEGGLGG